MVKLSKFYITATLAAILLTGCTPTEEVTEEKTPAAETVEVETEAIVEEIPEAEETEPKKSLMINGTDYLSVEGIALEAGTDIAMVATNSKNSYWDVVEKGAVQAIADLNTALGYTGKSKIKLSFDAPKGEDVIEQINIIDQFLDKAPDALCVAFTDASSCKTQMDMAKNNGIKTIAFDTPDDSQLTETVVATDNRAAASEAAKKMFEAIDYEGKVAILVHNSLTQSAQVRKQAIIDEMTQNYNDKNIQFVEIVYAAQEERSESEILSELLAKYDDLAGIICTDKQTTEMVIDYAKGLEEVNFKIVGFDTSEKIITEVGNLLVGTMAQDPYSIGYATVVAAARSITNMGNEENICTEHVWIDAENLDSPEVQSVLNY